MKKIYPYLFSLIAFAYSTSAYAADEETLGGRLSAIVNESWNPIFILLIMMFGVGGLFFLARGLMKVVEAASNGGRATYGNAITYVFVGALLLFIPDAAGMGMTSILGEARGGSALGSTGLDYDDQTGITGSWMNQVVGNLAAVGDTENCMKSKEAATCMARNLAQNTIPMAIMALFAVAFIVGFIALANAIIDLAKSSERGEQKPHITRLVTAVLLMNSPLFYTQITQTLLGSIDSPITGGSLNTSSTLLKYPVGSELEVVKTYTELIGHSFTILSFFGAFAFVRGIFMIKGVAEGRGGQAGSYGMAITFIIAGILLANSKYSSCLVLSTFGGSAMGTGFCG